ncbi:hypothetical protein [Yinghuangia sp. YIM S10712]|uniref:hypothetical protein n=1 Tax=Yinghuangia sp. YIM S10712 TaxID=3436930 RepID=UPI003F5354EC
MASFRRSKFVVVAAVLSGAAFLTACQSDDKETNAAAASMAPAASGQPTAGAVPKASERPTQEANAPGQGKSTSATAPVTTAPGGSETRSTAEETGNGKGVNGTWFGNVKYLAPGKYTVSGMKDVEQQFFIAEDTEIWGAGEICGDAEGQSATKCTEEQLAAATKGIGVSAEVVIVNGIATVITEDH